MSCLVIANDLMSFRNIFFISTTFKKKLHSIFQKFVVFCRNFCPIRFLIPCEGVGNILQTNFCISALQICICFRDKKMFLLAYLEKKYEIAQGGGFYYNPPTWRLKIPISLTFSWSAFSKNIIRTSQPLNLGIQNLRF